MYSFIPLSGLKSYVIAHYAHCYTTQYKPPTSWLPVSVVGSVLEQDTEPLIAPDVQCAISVNVKCVYILVSRFG